MNRTFASAIMAFTILAAPAAHAADVALTETQVRREILGKNLDHNKLIHITYTPDGKYSSGDGRLGRMGVYRVEADGRICWKDEVGMMRDAGCFQYYRRNGQLRVRRTDVRDGDIGPVTVQ